VFRMGYTTDDDGSGIGMAIVREVVEAHGWSISVGESQSGGARFDVTGVEPLE
jgi:two-component system OmpR family sensor kinase